METAFRLMWAALVCGMVVAIVAWCVAVMVED